MTIQKSKRENPDRVLIVPITFNVDRNFYKRIRDYAYKRNLNLSKAIRQLITDGLNKVAIDEA